MGRQEGCESTFILMESLALNATTFLISYKVLEEFQPRVRDRGQVCEVCVKSVGFSEFRPWTAVKAFN